MDATKNPFTAAEFKGLADTLFTTGCDEQALQLALQFYERAGELVSAEDYRINGELILTHVPAMESKRVSYSPGTVWPSVSLAFAYLSKHNPDQAKQRIAQFSDTLLDQPDISKVTPNLDALVKNYAMIGLPIPLGKALKAAQLAEKTGRFELAAQFYAQAGMRDSAKQMGVLALRSDEGYSYRRAYSARTAFQAAGDEESLAIVQFLDKNLR